MLLLKADSGLATPDETGLLIRYPGLSDGFERKILAAALSPNTHFAIKKGAETIDFSSDEVVDKGRPKWGLSLEQKLIGWVMLSQPWGLPTVIAKCMLWPDEVFSFLQLDGRIEVALHRARQRFKVSLTIENDRIFVSPSDVKKLQVIPKTLGHSATPSFFRSTESFERGDVEEYYATTKSSASRWLVDWIHRGWVERNTIQNGRNRYIVKRLK